MKLDPPFHDSRPVQSGDRRDTITLAAPPAITSGNRAGAIYWAVGDVIRYRLPGIGGAILSRHHNEHQMLGFVEVCLEVIQQGRNLREVIFVLRWLQRRPIDKGGIADNVILIIELAQFSQKLIPGTRRLNSKLTARPQNRIRCQIMPRIPFDGMTGRRNLNRAACVSVSTAQGAVGASTRLVRAGLT